jgi:hypothetical protein
MERLLTKLESFYPLKEQSTAEKEKKVQAEATIDKELLEINKRISEIDLAIANLAKREKEGSLIRSESLKQQAIELQKKVAEIQKKSVAVKKMEDLKK